MPETLQRVIDNTARRMKLEASQLKKLVKGEFFKLKGSDTAPVWICDYYDRSARQYWVHKFDDINHGKFISGNRIVYFGFTF